MRRILPVMMVLTLGCLECPCDDDDSATTYEETCTWTEAPVAIGAVACSVTWPGTVDVYDFHAVDPPLAVDGLVAMWGSWVPTYTEWDGVTYIEAADCAGIPGDVVQVAPPEVAVVGGDVLVRMVPGGSPPLALLVLECAP